MSDPIIVQVTEAAPIQVQAPAAPSPLELTLLLASGVVGPKGDTGAQGPVGPATTAVVDRLTLSSSHITSSSVTLSAAPVTPSAVLCVPDGGPAQKYGVDFIVSGTTLSWSGLGLATNLAAGDILIISYLT